MVCVALHDHVQPVALQSADQMTKQKPQAALWCFVMQSRGHKASWQNQKNLQLLRHIVAGTKFSPDLVQLNLSHVPQATYLCYPDPEYTRVTAEETQCHIATSPPWLIGRQMQPFSCTRYQPLPW